jgi:hypothetical protein
MGSPMAEEAYLGGARTMEFNERVYRSRSRPWISLRGAYSYTGIGNWTLQIRRILGSLQLGNLLQLTFMKDCTCSTYKMTIDKMPKTCCMDWFHHIITDQPRARFSIMDYGQPTIV